MAEIKCAKCGGAIPDASKFCPDCGTAVQVHVTTTATITPPQGTPVAPPQGAPARSGVSAVIADPDLAALLAGARAKPKAPPPPLPSAEKAEEADDSSFEPVATTTATAGDDDGSFEPIEADDDEEEEEDEDDSFEPARKGGTSPHTPFRAVQPPATTRAKPGHVAKAKAEAQAQADAKAQAEAAAKYAAGQAAVRALERHEPVDDEEKDSELLEALKREFRRRSANAKKRGWLKPALAVGVLILAVIALAMGWRSCGSPPDYTTAPRRRPAPTQQEPAWTEPAETEPTPVQQQDPAPPNDGEFPLCSTGRRHRIVISLAEYAEGRQDGYDLVLTRNGGQTTVRCRVAAQGDNFTADCCR